MPCGCPRSIQNGPSFLILVQSAAGEKKFEIQHRAAAVCAAGPDRPGRRPGVCAGGGWVACAHVRPKSPPTWLLPGEQREATCVPGWLCTKRRAKSPPSLLLLGKQRPATCAWLRCTRRRAKGPPRWLLRGEQRSATWACSVLVWAPQRRPTCGYCSCKATSELPRAWGRLPGQILREPPSKAKASREEQAKT